MAVVDLRLLPAAPALPAVVVEEVPAEMMTKAMAIGAQALNLLGHRLHRRLLRGARPEVDPTRRKSCAIWPKLSAIVSAARLTP